MPEGKKVKAFIGPIITGVLDLVVGGGSCRENLEGPNLHVKNGRDGRRKWISHWGRGESSGGVEIQSGRYGPRENVDRSTWEKDELAERVRAE